MRYTIVIDLTSNFGVYKIESSHEQGVVKLPSSYGGVPVSLCTYCVVATFQLFYD